MNIAQKRWISIWGIMVFCLARCRAVSAAVKETLPVTFTDGIADTYMVSAPAYIPYHSGDKYDLIIPDNTENEYVWLQDALAAYPEQNEYTHEFKNITLDERENQNMTVNTWSYDPNAAPLNIPDATEITNVSYSSYSTGKVSETYTVCYYTNAGEYVILKYMSNGRKMKHIRETSNIDDSILVYNSANEYVIRYQGIDSAKQNDKHKQPDSVIPEETGFVKGGDKEEDKKKK